VGDIDSSDSFKKISAKGRRREKGGGWRAMEIDAFYIIYSRGGGIVGEKKNNGGTNAGVNLTHHRRRRKMGKAFQKIHCYKAANKCSVRLLCQRMARMCTQCEKVLGHRPQKLSFIHRKKHSVNMTSGVMKRD